MLRNTPRSSKVVVRLFESSEQLAVAAAAKASEVIKAAVAKRGIARVLAATGNSQIKTAQALVARSDIPWGAVEIFHLDEYVGIDANHPASFKKWIKERICDKCHPRAAYYLDGRALDGEAHVAEYSERLFSGPVDLAFVGFGENGHIAFNDPPVADFDDPQLVKIVELDQQCRAQQVGEGHFSSLSHVPRYAMSVSCSGLLRANTWICCVPDRRKAVAVQAALEGPVTTACPASLVQQHADAHVYLDTESASLLSEGNRLLYRNHTAARQ